MSLIYIISMNGLSNQLFQLFNVISYCLDHQKDYRIYVSNNTFFPRDLYFPINNYYDNILSSIKDKIIYELPSLIYRNDNYHSYTPIPNFNEDILFIGNFQSYKYFCHNFNIISSILNLPKIEIYQNTISICFKYINTNNISYYIKSLNYLYSIYNEQENNINLVVNKLQSIFNKFQFIIRKNINDYDDLFEIASCQHHIISNDMFGWWGAYLCPNKNKIVLYSKNWTNNDIIDLYPDEWINIE